MKIYYNLKLRLLLLIKPHALIGHQTVYLNLPAPPIGRDAKSLYFFYWFAENLQYFPYQLIPISTHINKNNNKILWGACFSILHLNFTYDEYFKKVIKSPERALIRKAMKNGFYVQRIEYDDYLEQIKAINTSKAMRGGHEMDKDYINPKKRDVLIKPINPHIYTYGCFNPEGTLVAYYMFERFTNFYHTVKGIGHSEYLNMGIMNYLFAYSVSDLAKRQPDMLLVYGGMGTDGLSRFKKNVGCIGSSIIYSGKKESFRVLKHFIKRYHLHNDTALNYVTDYIY